MMALFRATKSFRFIKSTILFWVITLLCRMTWAADVVWTFPAPFSSDTDVITAGSLDRAYVMGLGASQITVNGVKFDRFGKNLEGNQDKDSVSDGNTLLVTGAVDQGIHADSRQNNRGLEALTDAYQTLLSSGIEGGGSPWALILDGLVTGKTYYFQAWLRDPLHSKMTVTVSGGTNNVEVDTVNGCYLIGKFVADSPRQIITFTPQIGVPVIEAFQLRQANNTDNSVDILQQPNPATATSGTTSGLSVFAIGASSYQWQKIDGINISDVVDGGDVAGSRTSVLRFNAIHPEQAGVYRVKVMNPLGSTISSNVTVMVECDSLINVAVSGETPVAYKGAAVLSGGPDDKWNSVDARNSFTNALLFDSSGNATPVTLTLIKSDGSAVPNALLGGISFSTNQIVLIKNLEPNEYYDLVVFSVGAAQNEGGIFSGAVNGEVRGYVSPNTMPEEFSSGINYVENPFARTDARGTLEFTIKPNATTMPDGYFNGDFNGLQMRKSSIKDSVLIIKKQPATVAAYEHQPATLNILAVSPPDAVPVYRWQKITSEGVSNLCDRDNLAGATSDTLTFKKLSADDNGRYQVVISNAYGVVTSSVATVTVYTNQLINVAVNPGGKQSDYSGQAVLPGTRNDRWNGIDARHSFTDHPLFDSTGHATPITLSLKKNRGDALFHNLLGGISWGWPDQIVTINHLTPNAFYNLVVFSIGGERNEGGVFTGAVHGISRGYSRQGMVIGNFLRGTNYVENPFAKADAQGTLTVRIQPNVTVIPDGFVNCDFNGLQLRKTSLDDQPPVITEPPTSLKAYLRHPAALRVVAASPANTPTVYQWQKITEAGPAVVADGDFVSGSASNTLTFQSVSFGAGGRYQAVVMNSFGSVTSSIVNLVVTTNQLINVAVNPGDRMTSYRGLAVFAGATNDFWNGIDGRGDMTTRPLFDATGTITPVTLSLSKKGDSSAIPCQFMGGISYATNQVVTINHLLPNEIYDIAVFSVGDQQNEGGVFSGALNGTTRGYPKRGSVRAEFENGVNYIENRTAYSDAKGTLSFSINPNSTIMSDGYYNCDFNGLQIIEGAGYPHVPGR